MCKIRIGAKRDSVQNGICKIGKRNAKVGIGGWVGIFEESDSRGVETIILPLYSVGQAAGSAWREGDESMGWYDDEYFLYMHKHSYLSLAQDGFQIVTFDANSRVDS